MNDNSIVFMTMITPITRATMVAPVRAARKNSMLRSTRPNSLARRTVARLGCSDSIWRRTASILAPGRTCTATNVTVPGLRSDACMGMSGSIEAVSPKTCSIEYNPTT